MTGQFVRSGISYLNREEEAEVKNKIVGSASAVFDIDLEYAFDLINEEVGKWLSSAKIGDVLTVKEIQRNNSEVFYVLHKSMRERGLWSYITNEGFCVQKVTQEEFQQLTKDENLECELVESLLGFTKVFRLLTALKKPIVGHNVLTDLTLMAHTFEAPLPHSYKKYKKFLHDLFPTVYDTKIISYEIRNSLPENKRWKKSLVETLYFYFKDGDGRHLALNSPYIKMTGDVVVDHFHNAGFDSYCTGYIFIRMAHLLASKGTTNAKQVFMSGQLLSAVSHHKNYLNVIRGAVAYVVSALL